MTRAPTLPTLLRRADAIRAKGDAIFEAQTVADRAVRVEAIRQARAALVKRGITKDPKPIITFADDKRSRWWPGPWRLDRIEVYPAKDMHGAFVWRAGVHITGFNKRGKSLKTSHTQWFDLQHPADLAKEMKMVKETT
jgi:hypothetical protein